MPATNAVSERSFSKPPFNYRRLAKLKKQQYLKTEKPMLKTMNRRSFQNNSDGSQNSSGSSGVNRNHM